MKIFSAILTVALSASFLFANAQDLDAATVKTMVDSGKFVFVAQTMVPSGGGSRTVDNSYDVKVSRNSVVTYLPYIGRAYTGIMPNETGVNFTSSSFDYKSKFRKKRWEVNIKPKDSRTVQELQFTVFDNGTATLRLIPENKQSITYYGYLKKS
jgi:hypothetical protein